MNKLTVLSLGLLSAAGLGLTTADAKVKLVLDQSTTLGMVADSTYDLANNLIEVSLDRPVLCNKATGYSPSGLTKLKVYDPNLEMKGGFTNGMYLSTDANYEVNNGFFHLNTDNPSKALCVSAEVGNFDLIFKTPFEDVNINTARLEYVGLPNVVAPGQILNYDIKFSNYSGASVQFDLLEYWPQRTDFDAYIEASGNTRQCNDAHQDVNCIVTDAQSGVMKNITLANTGELVVHVTQQVNSNAVPGSELDFMAAIFMKDSNGNFKPRAFSEDPYPHDPHIVSHTASVQNNNPPTVNWVSGSEPLSLTSFYEDEATSKVFEIEYGDNETAAVDLDVTVTDAIGNILNVTKGPFTPAGLNGKMTLTVLPMADAYTDNDLEQITVTVTDAAGGVASLTFDVEVIPVNDAPSISLTCTDIAINEQLETIDCLSGGSGNQLQGVWNLSNFASNFNPGPNERDNILGYEVEVLNTGGGVLSSTGNGSPIIIDTGNGNLSVVTNDGVYGTAQVRIRVQDDGGGEHGPEGCVLPINPVNGGCDVSEWQTLNITTIPPTFNFSGVINGLTQGQFVYLKLFETSNGDVLEENKIITINGNGSVPFSFSYNAMSQYNYKVVVYSQEPNYNCDISSVASTQVDPDTITGILNNADVNDIIVTCSEIVP